MVLTHNSRSQQYEPLVSTFSIVGYDPDIPAWGIAVASRFLAVGARTCWGSADAGVVVVQAYLNAQNGTEGVRLLQQGMSAEQVIKRLMDQDEHKDYRQLAIIDRQGQPATYTGSACEAWAGGFVGEHCAAQGNMLLGAEGCQAMIDHFSNSQASLERRLVSALGIADQVAGDARGRQSAALLVLRPATEKPFDVFTEPSIDLRVDDHPNPFHELERLLDLHELLFLPTADHEKLSCDHLNVTRLQRAMRKLGYYQHEPSGLMDSATQEALSKLVRHHNLGRRLGDPSSLDDRALRYLENEAERV